MSHQVEPREQRHRLERRQEGGHRKEEAGQEVHGRGAGVAPRHRAPRSLGVGRDVAGHLLYPRPEAPQPVVPHADHIGRTLGRELVELLGQLVQVRHLGVRHLGVDVPRVPRPAPVVPQAEHELVDEEGGQDEVGAAHQHGVDDVHRDGGRRVLPVADVDEPPERREQGRQRRHEAEEVGFAAAHAPPVRVRLAEVLDALPPQRRVHPAQPVRDERDRLPPQRLLVHDGQRAVVVHRRQVRLRVRLEQAQRRRAREPHGELELAHLLDAAAVEGDERVRVRVDAAGLERRQPDAHLAEEDVLDGVARHEATLVAYLAVVEDGDGEHGAVVVHVPEALLVEPRREAVDDGLRAEPLHAVLGHAVGVAGASPVARAHGAQAERVVDAELDEANGRPVVPQLPRRRPDVAQVVDRL